MNRHFRLIGLLTICAVLLIPLGAMADSIDPPTMSFTGSLTGPVIYHVTKTVTVNAGTPTTAQADIMFLSDTTGSMFGTISTVQTGASSILTNTASLGDVRWAVGEYRDNGDTFVYRLNQAMTADQTAVQTALNGWTAGGGGDAPEANLFAIQQSTLADTGWRADSARILVQFGDAPGHDPSGPTGVTLAQAEAALVGPPVTKLIAVDVGAKDSTGQETAMVNAVNGVSSGSVVLHNPSSSDLVNAVIDAIGQSFSTYSTVSLELVAPDGITVFGDLVQTGSWDRSVDRTFDFDFYLAGCCAALGDEDVSFEIRALVDGVLVATETDHWTCAPIPVPPSLILLGSGLLGLIGFRRFKLN